MSIDSETEVSHESQEVKLCDQCGVEKSLDDFYGNPSNGADGKTNRCKECILTNRKAKYAQRKEATELELAKFDRVTKFVKGFLDVKELTDDELQGRFIFNDDGPDGSFKTKVKIADIEYLNRPGNRFMAKLNKELTLRINEFIKSKSLRAVQVIFEIADSELVEPSDRFKASTWLAERVIGKTPEVLLTGEAGKPYEAIFDDAVETGSREAYRQRIESNRDEALKEIESEDSRDGIYSDSGRILDAEVEDEKGFEYGENDDLEVKAAPVGYDGVDGEKTGRLGDSGSQGTSDISGNQGNDAALAGIGNRTGINGGEFSDSEDTGLTVAGERRTEYKNEKERLRKARQKAKQRRFAARAVGATSLERLPYLLEFTLIKRGAMAGKLMCRAVCPSELTEARFAKLNEVNALTDTALSLLYPDIDDEDYPVGQKPELGEDDGEESNGESFDSGSFTENGETL